MKKGRITTIVLFVVLGVLLLLYFIFVDDEKHFQWTQNHRADNDQPYGALFIKRLLESYKPEGHFIFNDKKPLKDVLTKKMKNTSYVFIGQSLYLDDNDQTALYQFIEAGNEAFISSVEPPSVVLSQVYNAECEDELSFEGVLLDSANMNFYHDTLRTQKGYTYIYRFDNKNTAYYWNCLKPDAFCDSTKSIVPLGYMNPKHVNFFKLSYGKGNLYVHTDPLVFANYFLLKEDKLDYVTGVFSHLKGKDIIWDEFSKLPYVDKNNDQLSNPLYYILQQPSLKYAWWLFLAAVVLYIFFVAKRTQRVVPVLELKSNTSLEFVNMIAALHFQNGNHLDMARKKMRYFQYFVRSRYGIHTQSVTDDLILKLAEKSKVNSTDIKLIFDIYSAIEKESYYNITAYRLEELYNAIEIFYKQCK